MRAGLMIRNGYGDMQKLRIVGGRRLVGQVKASGAKNAALPIIAAALLTADDVVLHNVPELADVRTMAKLLEGMGVAFEDLGNGTVRMNAGNITSTQAPYELVKPCGPQCLFSARLRRVSAMHACRCRAVVQSVHVPWISISRRSR